MSFTAKLQLTRIPFAADQPIPGAWKEVYQQTSDASIFLSPEWTLTWIEKYGHAFRGTWLVWLESGAPVAVVLLLYRRGKFGPVPVRLGVVNTSCEVGADGVFIEYNDILCLPHLREEICHSLAEVLRAESWDQLICSGYTTDSVLAHVIEQLQPCRAVTKAVPSSFVELAKIRERGQDALLSGSTRSQIRRSVKLYADRGPVAVQAAHSQAEAHDFLKELSALHQASWQARGASGAFASARFTAFHHTVIDRLWETGNIHLLRVAAGDQQIGVLYNFFAKGKVYFYQSGFAYEADNRLKPGLMSHALAIRHYADLGAVEYDFLAGDARYKRSLATNDRQLSWTTVDRHSLKIRLLRRLADWRRSTRDQKAEETVT